MECLARPHDWGRSLKKGRKVSKLCVPLPGRNADIFTVIITVEKIAKNAV